MVLTLSPTMRSRISNPCIWLIAALLVLATRLYSALNRSGQTTNFSFVACPPITVGKK